MKIKLMKMKTPSDSKTVISQVMVQRNAQSISCTRSYSFFVQNDANHYGTIHGGVILKLIDNAAWVCTVRHAEQMCVTASIDRIDFCLPIKVGELVTLEAIIVYVGKTSIDIIVTTTSEDLQKCQVRHTNTSYVTMVAVTKQGKPTFVPRMRFVTLEEKRLCEEAAHRRKKRTII